MLHLSKYALIDICILTNTCADLEETSHKQALPQHVSINTVSADLQALLPSAQPECILNTPHGLALIQSHTCANSALQATLALSVPCA